MKHLARHIEVYSNRLRNADQAVPVILQSFSCRLTHWLWIDFYGCQQILRMNVYLGEHDFPEPREYLFQSF